MRIIKDKVFIFSVVLTTVLFISTVSYGSYATFRGIKKNKIEYYEVYIGNTLILRFRDKDGYKTSLERTMDLVEKFNKIFRKNSNPKLYDFKFNLKKKSILYKNISLIKITRADINANKTELLALGLMWLNRIRIGILNTKNYKLGHKVMGWVSWYGRRFHGRKTAYGETYNRFELTAASLKYPYNTLLVVTNPKNKKKVIIRINDKGPYVKSRILDLSEGSAYILGMKKEGVKKLIIQVIKIAK